LLAAAGKLVNSVASAVAARGTGFIDVSLLLDRAVAAGWLQGSSYRAAAAASS